METQDLLLIDRLNLFKTQGYDKQGFTVLGRHGKRQRI